MITRARILAVAVAVWGFGLALAFQKGWFDFLPDWLVVAVLVIPFLAFMLILSSTKEVKNSTTKVGKMISLGLFLGVGGLVGLGLGFAAYKVATRPMSQVDNDPKKLPTQAVLQALKAKAENLSIQIFTFLDDWKRQEPQSGAKLGEIWGRKPFDSEAFSKAFGEAGNLRTKHAKEMSTRFAQQFAARVSSVRDEMAGMGFRSQGLDNILRDRLRFEWDIQAIAEELQKLANSIKD
jgi:hypothetical protein